jgi:hypothetical protein
MRDHAHLVWVAALAAILLAIPHAAVGDAGLGPEQIVQAGGADLFVPGYSTPCYADWNADGAVDLLVGEGGGGFSPAKLRVYLNDGTRQAPAFDGYVYAQADGADLTAVASGCLGLLPRLVDWDNDTKPDLIVGQADGTVMWYRNVAADDNPTFDAGTLLRVGPTGAKDTLSVGARATPAIADWNNDAKKDLIVGALDGRVRVYLNEGTDAAPDFLVALTLQEGSGDLVVPSIRSSPHVVDWDGDGRKDLVTGNTNGQLLLYRNVGTDAAPAFGASEALAADGVPIDLPGTPRSRPFACDWSGDGYANVLIGAGDGRVHLYEGVPEPATLGLLAAGGLPLVLRRRRRRAGRR